MKSLRKQNDKQFFNAVKRGSTLVIDIMDVIGQDFFGEGITARNVNDAIKQAGEFDSITVNVASPGGDLFDGVGIHNLLRATGKPIKVNVLGLAASAASLVAMAGDDIRLGLGSALMVHNAMALVMGNSADMRSMANTLDTVSDSAADIYVAQTGMPKANVKRLMSLETWYTPEEAIASGFAHGMMTREDMPMEPDRMPMPPQNLFDLSHFKNVPDVLKSKAEAPKLEVPEVKVEAKTEATPEAKLEVPEPLVEEPEEFDALPLMQKRLAILRSR